MQQLNEAKPITPPTATSPATPRPAEKAAPAPVSMGIGEFFVLKFYTAYICFMYEILMMSQIGNLIYNTFSGMVPTLIGCGNDTFANVSSDSKARCDAFAAARALDKSCKLHMDSEFNSVNQEFEMVCDKANIVKYSTAIQMVGLMVGHMAFGQVSDTIGRRLTLIIGSVGLSLSCLVASFAHEMITFTIGRFIIMIFNACTYSVANVFMAENLPPKHRMWLMTIITYSPNYLVVSVIAFFTRDWRWMMRVIGIIAALPIVIALVTFESPRWLLRKRRFDECRAAIVGIGKWDGTNCDEKMVAFEEILGKEKQRLEKEQLKKATEKKYTVLDLFKHRKVAIYVCFFSYSLCFTSFVYYGIMFNMEHVGGNVFLNTVVVGLIRYSLNIVCAVLDIKFAWVGRIPLHVFAMGVITAGLTVDFALVTTGMAAQLRQLFVTIAMTAAAFCSEIYILVNVSSTELFPTPIRNLGIGFTQVWNGIGHAIAPPAFQFAKIWVPLPYLLMMIVCALDITFLLLFIPETKGWPMPERTTTKTKTKTKEGELDTAPTQPSATEKSAREKNAKSSGDGEKPSAAANNDDPEKGKDEDPTKKTDTTQKTNTQ